MPRCVLYLSLQKTKNSKTMSITQKDSLANSIVACRTIANIFKPNSLRSRRNIHFLEQSPNKVKKKQTVETFWKPKTRMRFFSVWGRIRNEGHPFGKRRIRGRLKTNRSSESFTFLAVKVRMSSKHDFCTRLPGPGLCWGTFLRRKIIFIGCQFWLFLVKTF